MLDYIIICIAAFFAGILNTLAGGGTFLTFPALSYIGIAPVMANATSAVAVFPGYLSGALGFRKNDPVNWFLNGKDDIRSSYYLEDVATEFDIQGLELDWTGMCWDADLRMEGGIWAHYNFKGTKWQNVNDRFRRAYLSSGVAADGKRNA